MVRKSRAIGKEVIKEIGKRILSGKFNLTKIPFPIKAMIPKSVLEASLHHTCVFPLYMGSAAATPDILERFKLTITANICSFFWTNTFYKPLNPILGETF